MEQLQDLVATRGGLAALRAMAKAMPSAPRPTKKKPNRSVFVPTDPAAVVQRLHFETR
jgi:hypothetical protein